MYMTKMKNRNHSVFKLSFCDSSLPNCSINEALYCSELYDPSWYQRLLSNSRYTMAFHLGPSL